MGPLGKPGKLERVGVKCLFAAANGEYFPDWEFETLIGAARSYVRRIAATWQSDSGPEIDAVNLAVVVLGNLAGYPHGMEKKLLDDVGYLGWEIDAVRKKLPTECC
jgi:hypothetical protein